MRNISIYTLLLVLAATACKPLSPEEIRMGQEQQILQERQRLDYAVRSRLGITAAEWQQFSPNDQLAFRQEQGDIERQMVSALYQQELLERQADGAYEIAVALREDSSRELYTNSAYGAVIHCQISGGQGKFDHSEWRPLRTTHFSIAQGDTREVAFHRADKQKYYEDFSVSFSDGRELEFCPGYGTDKSYKRCSRYPVTNAFEKGSAIPNFHIPSTITGATLTCSYAPGRR